jgi:hypothetical protein
VVGAEEKTLARWVRVLDWTRVDSEIGAQFAGERERVMDEFKAGQAQAFDISGPGYAGLIAVRFERRLSDGALQLHLITARGSGIEKAYQDLRRVARKAGAVALTADAENFGVLRMYQRAGWGIETARVRVEV